MSRKDRKKSNLKKINSAIDTKYKKARDREFIRQVVRKYE